jgi:hypothetical protein
MRAILEQCRRCAFTQQSETPNKNMKTKTYFLAALLCAVLGGTSIHAQTFEQNYAKEAQAEFDLRKDLYAAYGDGDNALILVSNHYISVGWPFSFMPVDKALHARRWALQGLNVFYGKSEFFDVTFWDRTGRAEALLKLSDFGPAEDGATHRAILDEIERLTSQINAHNRSR